MKFESEDAQKKFWNRKCSIYDKLSKVQNLYHFTKELKQKINPQNEELND